MASRKKSPTTSKKDDYRQVEAFTRKAWHTWLKKHHHQQNGIWLVRYRKGHDRYFSYDDVVEEALCFGWIDGQVRKLEDEERYVVLMTPRKKGSIWSALNKRRVEDLERRDAIEPAGRAAIDRAKDDGSWSILDDIDALIVPPDLEAALDEAGARAGFDAFSPSAKKLHLWALKSAKRPQTRAKRLADVVAKSAGNNG